MPIYVCENEKGKNHEPLMRDQSWSLTCKFLILSVSINRNRSLSTSVREQPRDETLDIEHVIRIHCEVTRLHLIPSLTSASPRRSMVSLSLSLSLRDIAVWHATIEVAVVRAIISSRSVRKGCDSGSILKKKKKKKKKKERGNESRLLWDYRTIERPLTPFFHGACARANNYPARGNYPPSPPWFRL